MRVGIIIGLLLLLVGTSGASALFSQQIMVTGAFACDSVQRILSWVNTDSQTFYVKAADIWMGMGLGSVSDFQVILVRTSDQVRLIRGSWDHYAEPTLPDHHLYRSFAPDWYVIAPGDGLQLKTFCTPIRAGSVGDANVLIYYTVGTP